jgi:exonuclease SbcD
VRYSGSPLCLSFDEERAKEVLLVEFGATLERVTPVAVPCFQPLAVVQGTLDTLGAALIEAAADGRPECPVWAEVVVAGDDYLADLQPRISALVAELPLEVLRVRRARSAIAPTLQGTRRETLEELSPLDVFSQRLAGETLDDDLRTRLEGLYREVLGELPA